MELKITPTPWELDPDSRPAEICTIHNLPASVSDGQSWAHVRGPIGYWDADEQEQLNNARLIVAAPDLYQGLTDAVAALVEDRDNLIRCTTLNGDLSTAEDIDRRGIEEATQLIERLRRILDKARGES